MTFVSFAQNFEDVVLWRVLHDVKAGRYIDIGAQDPEIDSVSLAFYNAGWRGIHVEPTAVYAAQLRDARPDETVIEAVVTDEPGPISFYEIAGTGLSTGCEEIAKKHSGDGYAYRKITVPCIRLDALLELPEGDIHWLKVDVEGMEADVLRSWGDSSVRPWVLAIEATLPNTQIGTTQLWIEEVLRRDYEPVFFDGLSRYFLHKSHHDLANRFEAPANVFDAFLVAPHHFTATEMRNQLESTRQRLDFEWARAEQNATEHSETRKALENAHEEHRRLLEELANSVQAHRAAVEGFSHERDRVDQRWRVREQTLRQEASEAQTVAASAQAELARIEERSDQLQIRLNSAEQISRDTASRERELRAELELIRRSFDLAASEFNSTAERLRQERDKVSADLERQRAQAECQTGRLQTEVHSLQEALARADALIRGAALERPGAWQRLGESLGFARHAEAHRALARWVSPFADHTQFGSMTTNLHSVEVGTEPAGGRNPYLRANSLSELLSWEGVDFVRCAYVTVLGRQPDDAGEAHYTDRLRHGRSKMEVLRDLRRSPEGSKHDPGIAGLDRALKRAHWGRYPVLQLFVPKWWERPSHRSAGHMQHTPNLSVVTDQLDALSARVEQMQRSLHFIEGSLVKVSGPTETLIPLDANSFMRRLAVTARDFETAVK